MATNNTIKIGYWGFKGLGEYPKLIAAFVGTPIEEVSEGATWKTEVKNSIGLDFPNLPYLIDGDVKIAESSAIPVYLAIKAGKADILGTGALEQALIRQLEGVLTDLRVGIVKPYFGPADTIVANITAAATTGAPFVKAAQLSAYLGDKQFFVGNRATLADILFAYVALLIEEPLAYAKQTNFLTAHANLKAHVARVLALPGIKERVTTEAWINTPFLPAKTA